MFRVEHLYKHVQESVKVEWNLGKRCNYDCSYCPAEIHDNFSKHTDIKILNKRVGNALNRPMIKGNVETNLEMLLNKRIKNYQKSHLKINTDNLSVNNICDKIIEGIL